LEATAKQLAAIDEAAQAVLDVRAGFSESPLADLYHALTMPPALTEAHQALDRAVDAGYGRRGFASDAERVAFLFELYQRRTLLLPSGEKPKKPKKPQKISPLTLFPHHACTVTKKRVQ
jgi:hypothetical protein